ncbi:HlyD family type I secretion periplasmic adaptor subunit [Hwanghaeella sp.]|uniref:HlyD family type I secretion periplasmic adaptor subunit n=1 Tax=Hwanghaeella sp. TaxID=2605943 RepID=UPI003CCBA127
MAGLGGSWDDDIFEDEGRKGVKSASRVAHIMLFTIVLFFVAFITWAYNATLDEVTRGEGRIIPSSQTQIVQHLEGGIVSEILVREGQIVLQGDPLMRIENRVAEADLAEKRKQYVNLLATAARLEAEAAGAESIEFPPDVMTRAPELATAEQRLFERRTDQLEQQVQILQEQTAQKRQELQEISSRRRQAENQLALADEEYKLLKPLVDQGVSAKIDLIRLQQKMEDLRSEVQTAKLAVPRLQSALNEARRRIEEKNSSFRTEAQQELNNTRVEASRLYEEISAGIDRATRTEVRSPVKGTVNKLLINTIGGVVRPGDDLVEIVPLEDALLVEARIKPSDRAQLFPGLKAVVKLTAYDFSIWGGLDAELIDISADTITDEQGETFYRIRLRTDETSLAPDKPITTGMTASVDILTGEKTVLQYLLKPILKAQQNALRER